LSSALGIESEIEKLSEVFRKFSSLVVEQGEMIRLIDDDVEAASIEVEEGQRYVAKTYDITKGNRGVIIKIFATILVLAVVLVST
jgi:syntaxin 5